MRATIVWSGKDGRVYGEPVAELEDGRRMPMGWNAGQVIPIGTTGEATYVRTSYAALWSFVEDTHEEGPC